MELKELQNQEDVARITRIAKATIETINVANEIVENDERRKTAVFLRDNIFALKSIANETETMQKAAKITRQINEAVKVYNAYIKRLKKESTEKFIRDHVEMLVDGK